MIRMTTLAFVAAAALTAASEARAQYGTRRIWRLRLGRLGLDAAEAAWPAGMGMLNGPRYVQRRTAQARSINANTA